MKKYSFKPTILTKYIDRFYVLEYSSEIDISMPLILPGTGLELIFHTDRSISINEKRLDKGHIICPRKRVAIDKTKAVSYISVRFKSGAFRHFSNIPYDEFNDQYVSVQDIWGHLGRELLQRLEDKKKVDEKIKLIEAFLMRRFQRNFVKEVRIWDDVIATLYGSYSTIALPELAFQANLSFRQFERKFKAQFGLTAKKFQRIVRFEDTVKKLLLSHQSQYLQIALDNGYYDQSHFIREFQHFVGQKPHEYFQPENFNNHFYFESQKNIRK